MPHLLWSAWQGGAEEQIGAAVQRPIALHSDVWQTAGSDIVLLQLRFQGYAANAGASSLL